MYVAIVFLRNYVTPSSSIAILLRLNMLKGVFKSPELSVIFFPLTHGIIRWLDDNHVIDLRRGSGSEYSQRRKKNRQHD